MKVLLDTQVLIWSSEDPSKLGGKAAAFISDKHTQRVISVASVWEMAIKLNIGKLTLLDGLSLSEFMAQSQFQLKATLLDIGYKHALTLEKMPRYHNDPFDRMLAAQCMCENMPIVSIDDKLDPYGITRIW